MPITFATGVLLLVAWDFITRFGLASPLFLPSPSEVVEQFIAVAQDGYANGTLAEHALASLGRIGLAFLIASSIGIPLGLLMGLNRWVKGVFDAPIGLYWPLPPLAYLPLLIIWFGIGETSKVVLLTLAMFAPICISAQAGVRSVSLERARGLVASRRSPADLYHRVAERAARDSHRPAHRRWRQLVTLGAAELIAAQRPRLRGHLGLELPGHRYRLCRPRRDRRRLRHRPVSGPCALSALARALEGKASSPFSSGKFFRKFHHDQSHQTADLFWYLPTHGDGPYLGTQGPPQTRFLRLYSRDIAQAADRVGFKVCPAYRHAPTTPDHRRRPSPPRERRCAPAPCGRRAAPPAKQAPSPSAARPPNNVAA